VAAKVLANHRACVVNIHSEDSELYGQVLATNSTMLTMCRDLGFEIVPEPGGLTRRRVTLRFKATS
jgi:hypothetical protein